jgi:hypothetical protein
MFDAELELEAELKKLMAVLSKSDLESEAEGEGLHPSKNTGQARLARDQAVVMAQIARGISDENKVTDAVFYDRHPEWKGRSLKYANLTLRREWMQLRNAAVRPLLKHHQATQPPATPASPPTHAAPSKSRRNVLAHSDFYNILKYGTQQQYIAALAAQGNYQKVSGFLPWYQKITSAYPAVHISESAQGVGNLVFSMDTELFRNLVEDEGIRNKVLEITAGGASELFFTEDVISVLGLGLTLLEIAQGLENERMLGGFGPDHDKWVQKQQLVFVFGLMAEDLSKGNWGNGYFFSRNARDLAFELANRFKEFQTIYNEYSRYLGLDGTLGRYQGNVPDFVPPDPPVMTSR